MTVKISFNTIFTQHCFQFTRVLISAAAAFFVMFSLSFAQDAPNGSWIAPGVIVKGDDERVFLMSPEGHVEALDMTNGEVLWRSDAAAKPVAIRGDNIIAQTENESAPSVLILTALDKRNGTLRGQDSIDLGPDVDTAIDDGLERSFVIDSGDLDTSSGDLYWRHYAQKALARPGPTPPVEEHFGAIEVGTDATALARPGGFARDTGRPPYSKPRAWRVLSETPASTVPIIDMETGLRFRLDGVPVDPGDVGGGTGGVVVGGTGAVVAVPQPTGGLIITEGGPGEEFPPTRRLPGDQFGHSSDERHILASAFAGRTDASEPYRWLIYERGTFNVAADFRARTSFAPFIVARDRVVYIRQPFELRQSGRMVAFPLAIVARDTSTGEIVWTRPVRDTRYTGPIPH